MDRRRALLDAILADPDDDAVRLIYADWLEEHGSGADRARARLIRLQIEVAGLEDEECARSRIAECRRLIDRHWKEWTPGFRAGRTGAAYYRDTFERGFLPYVCLDGEDLQDPALGAFLGSEPITRVFMRRVGAFPEAVATWEHLPRIRELSFSGGAGGRVKAVLNSPLLTGLVALNGSFVLDEADVALIAAEPRFAGLTRLDIRNNNLGDAAVARVARSRTLTGLTAFDYGGNLTTLAALEALAGSPLADRLTSLGLGQHDRGAAPRVGPRGAEVLAAFGRLQTLDLFGQQLGDRGVDILLRSRRLAGLSSLRLGQNGLGPRGVASLLASARLGKLTSLDLSENPPEGAWMVALAPSGVGRLRELLLEDNQLDGDSVARLAESAALGSLREFSLRGNPIGDRGADALARSPHLAKLRRLNLEMCAIGDAGAGALADSVALSGLDVNGLALDGNLYGPDAARRLRERFGAALDSE